MHPITHPAPEHLPGEPVEHLGPLQTARHVLIGLLALVASLAVGLPLLPLYLLIRLFLPRPPHRPSARAHLDLLGWILTEQPPPPGLPVRVRVGLLLELLRRLALLPLHGLAWYLDTLLYGRALRDVPITAPLFEISATRSGSTQLAHYLEEDPAIIAPGTLRTLYPYRWSWKLVGATLGRIISKDRVRAAMRRRLGEHFLQRHELDPFRTDTFEALFGMAHLGTLYLRTGPRLLAGALGEILSGTRPRGPTSDDFIEFLDAIARKTLLDHPGRRLMIKGHFLAQADTLLARYPDARFLTVLRVPEKRIQSAINYARVQPALPLCGPPPWAWLVEALVEVETGYCDLEHTWFGREASDEGSGRRCVVRFDDYVRDLEGTMTRIYRACLDTDLPPHVPRVHAERSRTGYTIDRSLAELGVDRDALNERCAAWLAWHARLGRGA